MSLFERYFWCSTEFYLFFLVCIPCAWLVMALSSVSYLAWNLSQLMLMALEVYGLIGKTSPITYQAQMQHVAVQGTWKQHVLGSCAWCCQEMIPASPIMLGGSDWGGPIWAQLQVRLAPGCGSVKDCDGCGLWLHLLRCALATAPQPILSGVGTPCYCCCCHRLLQGRWRSDSAKPKQFWQTSVT